MSRKQTIENVQKYVLDNFMTKRQSDVYKLIVFDGLTYDEAGKILGISKSNARNHFIRAKKKMNSYIKLASEILSEK